MRPSARLCARPRALPSCASCTITEALTRRIIFEQQCIYSLQATAHYFHFHNLCVCLCDQVFSEQFSFTLCFRRVAFTILMHFMVRPTTGGFSNGEQVICQQFILRLWLARVCVCAGSLFIHVCTSHFLTANMVSFVVRAICIENVFPDNNELF